MEVGVTALQDDVKVIPWAVERRGHDVEEAEDVLVLEVAQQTHLT